MHLWPSLRIRDSFKLSYLKSIEWNLHRMKRDKESQRQGKDKLLEDKKDIDKVEEQPQEKSSSSFLAELCGELVMPLSCCYCCFCCGACIQEEN